MFGKLITAMITPFDDNDQINDTELKKLIDHLIKNNTSTILVSGTTGEAPTLSESEKIDLFEKTLEYVDGRVPVMANVGTNSTKKTIDFIKKVEYLPLDAYLVVVPYYNKPDQEGMIEHFKSVAKVTEKPIMIYNIPSRTGVEMTFETMKELNKVHNIVGVKESNKNVDNIKKIKDELKDFQAYVGDDALLYDALKVHADGIVSVASHIYGRTIHNIIQLMRKKQFKDAEAIFTIYNPKFKALFMKPNPVPLKTVLNKLGFNVGGVRLPLVEMSNEKKKELFNMLGV